MFTKRTFWSESPLAIVRPFVVSCDWNVELFEGGLMSKLNRWRETERDLFGTFVEGGWGIYVLNHSLSIINALAGIIYIL